MRTSLATCLFCVVLLGCKPGEPPARGPTAGEPRQASREPSPQRSPSIASPDEIASGPFQFQDVSERAGVRFIHAAPFTPERHLHLVMGSGVGWLDFDRDGWPDLYCCQGAPYTPDADASKSPPTIESSDRLFQNLGDGRFTDMTPQAGLLESRFTMGISVADYDNDGFLDAFITGYHENSLWHNLGDGTFVREEIPAEVVPGRLSASCAWGDIDADGNLDLFVTNYASLPRDRYPLCHATGGGKTISIGCHPSQLTPMPDLLYHNLGQGEFAEISSVAGIAAESRCGLGVAAADLDHDGDLDFFVANDTTPNHLWENQGGLRFLERGASSGTATNRHGASEAGMGVALGDVDGNGQFDLFVTNFFGETNTLYRNEGHLAFTDVTHEVGLGGISFQRLGFGVSLADFDGDEWLDLIVFNGHIHDRLQEIGRNEDYAQLPLAYHNERGQRFREVSAASGPFFRRSSVGRGSAVADYNRDGKPDVAVNRLNEPLTLLQNVTASNHRWLGVELLGVVSNRNGIGTVLRADTGTHQLTRCVQAGASYLSCDDGPVVLGCGEATEVQVLIVTWPSGRREQWRSLATGRFWQLIEGSGEATEP